MLARSGSPASCSGGVSRPASVGSPSAGVGVEGPAGLGLGPQARRPAGCRGAGRESRRRPRSAWRGGCGSAARARSRASRTGSAWRAPAPGCVCPSPASRLRSWKSKWDPPPTSACIPTARRCTTTRASRMAWPCMLLASAQTGASSRWSSASRKRTSPGSTKARRAPTRCATCSGRRTRVAVPALQRDIWAYRCDQWRPDAEGFDVQISPDSVVREVYIENDPDNR